MAMSGHITGPGSGASTGQPQMSRADAGRYLQRGYQAMMRRDFKEAGACCNLVLKYHPRLVEGHFLVGLIGVESGDWVTARRAFKNVVSLDENHGAGWAQLARCCARMGQFSLAEKALINAKASLADDALVFDIIGSVHSLLGDQIEALAWFDRAKAKSGSAFFELSRAKALTFLGRLDEADTALRGVLAAKPDEAMAHWMLSRLEKARDDSHLTDMRSILASMPETHPDRAFLSYAVGKECEDLEDWDGAFAAYEAGARSRRSQVAFDEAEEEALFEALESCFTADWLSGQSEGSDATGPIFVVGQPRTGTTLVERIMTAHTDVHSAGELQQFAMAIKRQTEMSSPKPMTAEIVRKAAEIDLATLGDLYMETTNSVRGDTPMFVDKMPVNFMYLPLIAAALPNARIIHIVRDPMDSCFASYKQLFAEAYYHSYDQEEMARHHVRYRLLMDHWRALLGDRILDVAYEDVVADLDGNARRIIDHLGLDWQQACTEFHKQDTAVTTASAAQVREKAHTRSVGRWRKFEKQLAPMAQVLENAGLMEGST